MQPRTDTPIENFLKRYNKPRTVYTYQSGIRAFFDFIYHRTRETNGKGDQGKAVRSVYEKLAKDYFSEERDYGKDLEDYASSLNTKPGYTVQVYLTGIKELFDYYEIDLSRREQKNIRRAMPKARKRTVEKEIDHDKIRSIFSHMDVKSRAFFLVLLSSGMRIGEALQLCESDIDLTISPAEISIRPEYTKTDEQRITFISDEAREALLEWLKVRDSYIVSSQNRNAGLVREGHSMEKKSNGCLFPFSVSVASAMWATSLKAAGLSTKDPKTGRLQLHPHMLRKYFRTQLALKIPTDIVECLLGHEGYLSTYRIPTNKELREYYTKGEQALTIFIQEDTETRSRVEALEAELKMMREESAALRIAEKSALFQKLTMITQDPTKLNKLTALLEKL